MDGIQEDVKEEDSASWIQDSGVVMKHERAWFMEGDVPDQPLDVYSIVEPMSDNTALPSLDSKHPCCSCPAAFVLVSSLELHLALVHGEKLLMMLPESSTFDIADDWSNADVEMNNHNEGSISTNKVDHCDSSDEHGGKKRQHVYNGRRKSSTPDKFDVGNCRNGDADMEIKYCSKDNMSTNEVDHSGSGDKHGEKRRKPEVGKGTKSSTPDKCNADDCSCEDIDKEINSHNKYNTSAYKIDYSDSGTKKRRQQVCKDHRKSSTPEKCDADEDKEIDDHKRDSMLTNEVDHSDDGKKTRRQRVSDGHRKPSCQSGSLKRPMSIRSGARPFVCDVCRKRFSRPSQLNSHKRTHTGEKPYKCPECGSCFRESSYLFSHLKKSRCKPGNFKTHRKPSCKSGNLKRPMSIHSGALPFVCDVCSKSFCRPSQLNRHKRTHTGDRPYKCPECDKCFKESRHLSDHLLTHSSDRPHCCVNCPSAFKRPQDLKRHIQTVHRKD